MTPDSHLDGGRPRFIWGKFRQPVIGKPHHFLRDGVWWVYDGRRRHG